MRSIAHRFRISIKSDFLLGHLIICDITDVEAVNQKADVIENNRCLMDKSCF